jgi:hypothetical protein
MAQLTKSQVETILKNAPIGTDKKAILDGLITRGYDLEGVDNNAVRQNLQKQAEPEKGMVENVIGGTGEVIKGVAGDIVQMGKNIGDEGKELLSESANATPLEKARGIGEFALRSTGQVAKTAFSPIVQVMEKTGLTGMIGSGIQKAKDFLGQDESFNTVFNDLSGAAEKYKQWAEQNPDLAKDAEAVTDIAMLLVGGKAGKKAVEEGIAGGKATVGALKEGTEQAIKTGEKAVETITKPLSAITQVGGEFAERIPRAVNRGSEALEKAAVRAERIKTSAPAVQKAIKSNLDDRIINTISESDYATKQAYKKVLDIAEESPKTLGVKKQPTIVGGDLAVKQYDIINAQKKKIGKEIGDKINQLSKTEKIDITDVKNNLDDTLSSQGIIINKQPVISDSAGGLKVESNMDFSGTKFTPAERTKIEQLYKLANEGGDVLSPAQIKAKDELFSKLQRESRFEGLGDIVIQTPEGTKNLFQTFRDVYSSKLGEFSPELKALNQKYSKLIKLTDDIEDSILKTPNFNVTKVADQGEFAKVNLRRIFGESQSSPVYEAIADEMDTLARTLGYKDASPKDIILFAQELRKLYPETIPEAGFTGGIKSAVGGGIPGALKYVSEVGTPNIIDQRRALRELIEYYSNKNAMPSLKK